jgi:hypothetical protein
LRVDGARLEEDIFHLAVSQPKAMRSLTVEGCRILARQFRERVEARAGQAAALVGCGHAYPGGASSVADARAVSIGSGSVFRHGVEM